MGSRFRGNDELGIDIVPGTWTMYIAPMTDDITLRPAVATDLSALEILYAAAFPDEDLFPVVRTLSDFGPAVQSTVAVRDSAVVGHVMFTDCAVDGSAVRLSLLGPLAVTPVLHRQGIGGALVRNGFEACRVAGKDAALVLGDPNYYGRFGFAPERAVAPPYPLPAEWDGAWQSVRFGDAALPTGVLRVPAPWDDPALWSG